MHEFIHYKEKQTVLSSFWVVEDFEDIFDQYQYTAKERNLYFAF